MDLSAAREIQNREEQKKKDEAAAREFYEAEKKLH